MAAPHKTVIAFGLKSAVEEKHSDLSTQKIIESMKAEHQKLEQLGFKLSGHPLDHTQPIETLLAEAQKLLQSKPWDCVTIGNGIRGNEDFTGIFEKLVNMAIHEVKTPDGNPPRLAFPLLPTDVSESVLRVFPEMNKA